MGVSVSTPYYVYRIQCNSSEAPLITQVNDPAEQCHYEQIIRNIVAVEQDDWTHYRPSGTHDAYQILIVSVNGSNHRGRMQQVQIRRPSSLERFQTLPEKT